MDISVQARSPREVNVVLSQIPGDKSLSHRAIILGSLAENESRFSGFLFAQDCIDTLENFRELGVQIADDPTQKTVTIQGRGLYLSPSSTPAHLDCGNSGTGIRLMMGALAGQHFELELTGDASIQKRPMRRVIDPLTKMGANITGAKRPGSADIFPPLTSHPVPTLQPLTYTLPVASAQVKSAILLASLYSKQPTTIHEPEPCRDHTERMLQWYGADITVNNRTITCSGANPLRNPHPELVMAIPADISSAAFFIVFGCILPNCTLTLTDIGLNPTRSRILDVLIKMGANIDIKPVQTPSIEPMGDLIIRSSVLTNIDVDPADIPIIIDELPILAIAALFAKGQFRVRQAKELRVKESDRIASIRDMITAFGGQITEYEDGFDISGPITATSATIVSNGDHRIAMSGIIGAYASGLPAKIQSCDCINTSFPNFFDCLALLGGQFQETNS